MPLRVHLLISEDFRDLVLGELWQGIGCGELLGSIPARKPAGTWARVTGWYLLDMWRREAKNPRRFSIRPTRRELLTTIQPSTGSVENILSDATHAARVLRYWCDAMGYLVEQGIIADEGEPVAARAAVNAKRAKGWRDTWLDAKVEIIPGKASKEAVSASISGGNNT